MGKNDWEFEEAFQSIDDRLDRIEKVLVILIEKLDKQDKNKEEFKEKRRPYSKITAG